MICVEVCVGLRVWARRAGGKPSPELAARINSDDENLARGDNIILAKNDSKDSKITVVNP
jgi:hypothetical protein